MGKNHFQVLTADGVVIGWGSGEHGKLGNDSDQDISADKCQAIDTFQQAT